MKKEITLAIETAIGGGSISILENGSEIDHWEGKERVAKSEELLRNISNLIRENHLVKKDIKKIAVSIGPGSYTGIRTGIATAKGLQQAIKCQCYGISVLEAFIVNTIQVRPVITGFFYNKNEICWQVFESDKENTENSIKFPQIGSIKDFLFALKNSPKSELFFYRDFFTTISDHNLDYDLLNISELKENAAKYIGLKSFQPYEIKEIVPVYAREAPEQ